jgi:hypothetical protein
MPFVIFNPDATSFGLIAIKLWHGHCFPDGTMKSLWRKIALLYHCDSLNQLTLREYDAFVPVDYDD